MVHRLARAWRRHRLLLIAFLVALTVTLGMAGKLGLSWIYWSANHQREVATWMTPGYVAHSWRVDPLALFDELAGPLGLIRGRRETIAEIARRTGLPEAEVITMIQDAVADLEQGSGG
ncbi:MAG: hypothetical protein HUJ24_12225 [Rhodobacteraceae bacterium]|nr:hypothetical protein [Paracoccaceae bacterium]